MRWPQLRNKFLNTKSEIDRKAYSKQPNYCVTHLKKAKQTFFGNINTTDITDIKTFSRTVNFFAEIKLRLVQKLL